MASAWTTSASNCDAGEPPELLHRLGAAARRAIGARARHRVERVGDVDDAREHGDVVAVQAVRIALAVGPLVVQLDDRQVRREERDRAQDARAVTGCCLIASNSSSVSAPGLRSTSSLIPILPMSCRSAPSRSVSRSSSAAHCVPTATEIALTRSEWPAVYGIARVERERQRANRADVGAACLRLGRGHRRHQRVERVGQRVDFEARPGARDRRIEHAATWSARSANWTACRSDGRPCAPATGWPARHRQRAQRDQEQRADRVLRGWWRRRRRSSPACRRTGRRAAAAGGSRTARRSA